MRTVMCFGDSNTHGSPPMADFGPNPRYPRHVRWPGVLAGLLGEGWHLIEEGLGGRTTLRDDPVEGAMRNGLKLLPALLNSHRPLDLVVVMLGTNDVKWAYGMSPYEIGRGADKLLRAIEGSECGPDFGAPQALLVAPPPVMESGCLAEMYRGGAEKSQRLAAEYAAVARARGAAFLDAGAHTRVSPLDGVHWEADQHAGLAQAVAAKINEMFGGD